MGYAAPRHLPTLPFDALLRLQKPLFSLFFTKISASIQVIRRTANEKLANLRRIVQNE